MRSFIIFFLKDTSFIFGVPGTIIISNIMIGLKVVAALFIAIAVISKARLIRTKDGFQYKQSGERKR